MKLKIPVLDFLIQAIITSIVIIKLLVLYNVFDVKTIHIRISISIEFYNKIQFMRIRFLIVLIN